MARLAGQTTPPMGSLEPSVCDHGFYCPPGGKKKIVCPPGHFCPKGAYKPIKCTLGANCPEGSYFSRPLLPIALLGLLDLLLISLVIGAKLMKKTQTRSRRRENGIQRLKRAVRSSTATFRSPGFQSLPDDNLHLESQVAGIRRTPTGFGPDKDIYYTADTNTDGIYLDREKSSPEIQQFVHSLSRCTLVSRFGLSFEFENLKFQPNKRSEPVLSEVSGQIKGGTFWGVMGASGAGKSTFVNVLMGKSCLTSPFVAF